MIGGKTCQKCINIIKIVKEVLEKFKGKIIVVTGANGFIGCRLIELLSATNCEIRALVRNFGSSIRLARLPISIVQGDILDKESIREYFKGVDYVFHCAYGSSGSSQMRRKIDIDGTRNVIELSKEFNCKGLLFLSTISVYGLHGVGEVTEETPYLKSSDDYVLNKRAVEQLVTEHYLSSQLPAVILQPTGVYGPWAKSYGLKQIKYFKLKYYALEKGVDGIANLVYVDDLVQAMLKSVVNTNAYGNKYIISGLEHIEWKEFFSAFESITGNRNYVEYSGDELSKFYKMDQRRPSFLKALLGSLTVKKKEIKNLRKYVIIDFAINLFSRFSSKKLKKNLLSHSVEERSSNRNRVFLEGEIRQFYTTRSAALSRKATKDFGYDPKFGFKQGFEILKNWYYWFSGQNSER